MVTNLKGMAIWEALRGLKGLFSGSDSSQDSIKQEVASVLDRTSDEVILLPADAAIMAAKGPDGRKYLDAFQNILLSLKPHQREQWRRIVAKHVLTEKHEQVVTSRKTIKTGGKAAARETDKESPSLRRRDSGQQQNVSAREEISETFDRREGDCTEHAMLLAALCRARQIPARVAIGLVYYPSADGFAYHMWTEVWIEDRWIPLDATLGLGGIGGAHLKFAHSSMQGTAAYAELLPLAQALGRLQLELVSVE